MWRIKKDTIFSGKRLNLIAILVFFIVVTLLYLHSLNSPFHFDDEGTVTHNSFIRSLRNVFLRFNERPVLTFTFALNYYLGKLNPFGYHLVNVLLHFICGVLVYFVIIESLSFAGYSDSQQGRIQRIAFFSSLFFLAHPIRVESVVYVSSRSVLLCGAFFLLGFLFFLLSLRSQRFKNHLRAAVIVCSLLAIGSKEIGATFPFIIILFDYLLVAKTNLNHLKERRGFYILLFLTLGFTAYLIIGGYLHNVYGKASAAGFGITMVSPFRYLLTEFNVVLYYLLLFIFPYKLNLDYDWQFAKSLFEFPTFFSFLIILGIGVALFRMKQKKPLLFFFGLWYFIILAPDSSINPLKDPIFLHRTYLPSVGPIVWLFLAVDNLFLRLSLKKTPLSPGLNPPQETLERKKKNLIDSIETATLMIFILIFSIVTIKHANIWLSGIDLWEYVVKLSPRKARPHLNLGMAYKTAEFYEDPNAPRRLPSAIPNKINAPLESVLKYRPYLAKAMSEFETSFRIDPTYVKGRLNLGGTYYELGDFDTALVLIKEAVRINSNLPESQHNLGILYMARKEYDLAIQHFKTAVALRPDFPEALYNLATAYVTVDNINAAIDTYLKVIALNPSESNAYSDLGALYSKKGMLKEAIYFLSRAIRLTPKDAIAYYNLAVTYEKMQDDEKAAWCYQQALKINPLLQPALKSLINIYQQEGRFDEALGILQMWARQNPKDPTAATNLALARLRFDEWLQKINALQEIVKKEPQNKEARLKLAQAWIEAQAFKKAKELLKELIKQNPDYLEAHLHLGILYGTNREFNEAISQFEEAIRIDPKDYRPHYNLAIAYETAGATAKAKAEYEKTLKLKPNHTATLLNLSAILTKEGRVEEAMVLLNELLRYDHKCPEGYLNLGILYIQKKNLKQAEDNLKKALELKPDYPLAQFNLGKLYWELGKKELAQEKLNLLKKSQPLLAKKLQELIENK